MHPMGWEEGRLVEGLSHEREGSVPAVLRGVPGPPLQGQPPCDSRGLLAMNWQKDSLGLTMGTRGTSRDIPATQCLPDSATRPLGTGLRSPWSPDTGMGYGNLRLDKALTGRSVSCCLEDPCTGSQVITDLLPLIVCTYLSLAPPSPSSIPHP